MAGGVYTEMYNTLMTWLASQPPHKWMIEKVQNRLDMQNTYMSFSSVKNMEIWLKEMANRESAVTSGDLSFEGGIPSTVVGNGVYDA